MVLLFRRKLISKVNISFIYEIKKMGVYILARLGDCNFLFLFLRRFEGI